MNNNKYNEINIPKDIDIRIDNGIQMAILEKQRTNKNQKRNLIGTIAASLIAILTLGIANPALAAKIPIIGNVFEAIEKNINFPGNYSQYATSINETAYSNGIGITLSEILCDGQSLYVTYIVESEKPFKYTSLDENGTLDMNQLLTTEAYNKVDFSSEELDNIGFSGLEGKFIDENTFVGVNEYKLSTLEADIPDEFIFQTKIIAIDNYAINDEDKDYVRWGTWAFKVPVTVNKELRKAINLSEIENDVVKVNSISLTPFEMMIDVKYKMGDWSDYMILVYDENDAILATESIANDDRIGEKLFVKAPNLDTNSIRFVVEKLITKKTETYEGIGTEVIFDEIIRLK